MVTRDKGGRGMFLLCKYKNGYLSVFVYAQQKFSSGHNNNWLGRIWMKAEGRLHRVAEMHESISVLARCWRPRAPSPNSCLGRALYYPHWWPLTEIWRCQRACCPWLLRRGCRCDYRPDEMLGIGLIVPKRHSRAVNERLSHRRQSNWCFRSRLRLEQLCPRTGRSHTHLHQVQALAHCVNIRIWNSENIPYEPTLLYGHLFFLFKSDYFYCNECAVEIMRYSGKKQIKRQVRLCTFCKTL